MRNSKNTFVLGSHGGYLNLPRNAAAVEVNRFKLQKYRPLLVVIEDT